MVEVDFMIVCDYVRPEPSGVLHIMAAGIDRIYAAAVPAAQNVGVALRLLVTEEDTGKPLQLELIFKSEQDPSRLAGFRSISMVNYPEGVRRDLPLGVAVGVNVGLPLPGYGDYVLELLVDGQVKRTVRLTVSPPSASVAGPEAGAADSSSAEPRD